MGNPKKPLTDKQKAFAQEFARTGNVNRSAKAAGYKKTNSSEMMKSAAVAEMIEESRKSVMDSTKYNAQAAMEEAQRAIEFAVSTNNANAYVKAVELRSKLMGLLVEKVDVRGSLAPLTIQIAGIVREGRPEPIAVLSEEVKRELPAPSDVAGKESIFD